MKLRTFVGYLAFVCVVSSETNATAQTLTWKVGTANQRDSSRYEYTALSSFGESCIYAVSISDQRKGIRHRVWRGFLRSDDAGRSWRELDPHLSATDDMTTGQILTLQMIDSLHIVAAGDSGVFLSSSDAGATWKYLQFPDSGKIHHLHFANALTGMLCSYGDSDVKVTFDGGAHWRSTEILTTYSAPFSPQSLGGNRFRALGYAAGPLFYTDDGWHTVDSSRYAYPDSEWTYVLFEFRALGEDTLLAYGTNWPAPGNNVPFLTMARSLDSGRTWSPLAVPDSFVVKPIQMSDLVRPYVLLGGLGRNLFTAPYLYSFDHGASWQVDSFYLDAKPQLNTLTHITVLPSGTAIGVVGNGFVGNDVPVIGTLQQQSVTAFENIVNNTDITPNPCARSFAITTHAQSEPISIYDILGHEVLHGKLDGSGHAQFDVSALPRGVYSVILKHNGIPLSIGKLAVVSK
jgi:photosystem II stability/assembly factor-like uncharacterized protein